MGALHKVIILKKILRQLNTADQSSVGKIGPVHYSCTGPTFCPYRLISCLQLAHNTPHLSHSTFLYGTYSLGWSQERTADRLRTLRTLKLPGLPGTAVQVETWHSTTCVRFKGRVSWFFQPHFFIKQLLLVSF